MSELQERRYKEVLPEKTVEKLKGLLKQLGIEVEEKWIDASSVGTYSLRVCVKGTNIGQNGKGMTKEFAMASGYAEFFERFQNGMFRFRLEKPTKELPFTYAPDERTLSIEELMNKENSFLDNIVEANGHGKDTKEEQIKYIKHVLNQDTILVEKEDYLSLPYYSVKNSNITYVPERLFSYTCNSNGILWSASALAKSREFCTGTVVSGHVDQIKAGHVFSDTWHSRETAFLAASSSLCSPRILSIEPLCAYSSPERTA